MFVKKKKHYWDSLKNAIFRRWRGSPKKQDIVGLPKRGELRQFCRFKRVLAKKRGWCFCGRLDSPMHPICSFHGRHVSVRETGNIMSYVFLTV